MKIPKTAVNVLCPKCELSQEFKLYGTLKGTRRILYFKCKECGEITRMRTKK